MRELPRQARFVLALREDFLPQLEAQRDLLLQYDANSFRLEALGRAAAELAITESRPTGWGWPTSRRWCRPCWTT